MKSELLSWRKSIEPWRGSKNTVKSAFLPKTIVIFSFTLAFLHILCLCAYIDTFNLLYVIYVCVAVILWLSLHNRLNPEHEHCNPLMSYLWIKVWFAFVPVEPPLPSYMLGLTHDCGYWNVLILVTPLWLTKALTLLIMYYYVVQTLITPHF